MDGFSALYIYIYIYIYIDTSILNIINLKNEVGFQAIKVVKQEKNNDSYYSIAQWEIPTLACYNNYFVFNAKVGT